MDNDSADVIRSSREFCTAKSQRQLWISSWPLASPREKGQQGQVPPTFRYTQNMERRDKIDVLQGSCL